MKKQNKNIEINAIFRVPQMKKITRNRIRIDYTAPSLVQNIQKIFLKAVKRWHEFSILISFYSIFKEMSLVFKRWR